MIAAGRQLGLLVRQHVAGAADGLDVGRRRHELLLEPLGVHRRDEPVLLAPHQQRRVGDPVEALGQPTVGDREQDLAGRAEPAGVADQERS